MLQLQISQFGKCKYGKAETEAVSKILWHTHTHTLTHKHTLTETAEWGATLGWGHVVNIIKLIERNRKSNYNKNNYKSKRRENLKSIK